MKETKRRRRGRGRRTSFINVLNFIFRCLVATVTVFIFTQLGGNFYDADDDNNNKDTDGPQQQQQQRQEQEQGKRFDNNITAATTTTTNKTTTTSSSFTTSTSTSSFSFSSFEEALRQTTDILYHDSLSSSSSEESSLTNERIRNHYRNLPPPTIYVYKNLPYDWSNINNISDCIHKKFNLHRYIKQKQQKRKQQKNWKNCLWNPKICRNDIHPPYEPKHKLFMQYKNNYNGDVAYLQRFVGTTTTTISTTTMSANNNNNNYYYYYYPYQTDDPQLADLILVPYPHKSHCLCYKDFNTPTTSCKIPVEDIQHNILDRLTYLRPRRSLDDDGDTTNNASSKTTSSRTIWSMQSKHLFLFVSDSYQQTKRLLRDAAKHSLKLTLGPASSGNDNEIIIPYINSLPEFQPHNMLFEKKTKEQWWINNSLERRPYAVGVAFGEGNNMPDRTDFLRHYRKYIGETIGGKPNSIHTLGRDRDTTKINFYQLYQNSTFCLVLRGDDCPQKRFFDVILNGCIPVVPIFPNHNNYLDPLVYSERGGCTISNTYPFAKKPSRQEQQQTRNETRTTASPTTVLVGSSHSSSSSSIQNNNDFPQHGPAATTGSIGIDMNEIILTYNGTCGYKCMKDPIEKLLRNTTQLQARQLRLRDYAMLCTFGYIQDTTRMTPTTTEVEESSSLYYPDAFMATIVMLRHRLWQKRNGQQNQGLLPV